MRGPIPLSSTLALKVLGCGLLALLFTWGNDPLKTTGRRLFASPLEEIYPYETPMETYQPAGHMQVEQLLAPQDLLKLFKTVAGSPQDALQRMTLSGMPNEAQWTSALEDWKWGLSKKEIASIFHGIDVDNDGKVDLGELLSCFRHGYQGEIPAHSEAPPQQSSRYDCTDGLDVWRMDWSQEKIQSCSLISVMDLREHLRPQITAAEMVHAADLDGDGAISQAEWTAAATRGSDPFLKPITEPRAEFAFKSMDVSQDGTLSSSDLLGALDLSTNTATAPNAFPNVLPTPSSHFEAPIATGAISVKDLQQRLLVKWATLSNAFDKMDLDGNHRLSREEWASGLAELSPPLPSPSANYFFEGIDALHDGHLTPPELHGTLNLGQLFQSPEALRTALHWDKAQMDHHAKVSSWIHSARPNWQHDQESSSKDGGKKGVKDSQKLSLVQSLHGAFLSASDAFLSMDQDHSDDASMMEFKETLSRFHPPITGAQAVEAFQSLDRDGNGKVSRGEFGALESVTPRGGSLDHNMKHLMSKAEMEFRKQASKWAGSMKQACTQLGTEVSFGHFRASIHNFEPLLSAEAAEAIFKQMDTDQNGFIDGTECHLSLEDFRKTLSSTTSLRNSFVDADRNNDHQLSQMEFANFGQMLDSKNSLGKYAIFFEDELDTDHDGKVSLPTLETLVEKKSSGDNDLLSADDLISYDLPAIMHGKCIISALDAEIPPGIGDKVGQAFAAALGSELSLKLEIVGVQEIAHPSGQGKEFDLLYTSKTASGATCIRKLHDEATQIEATVREAVRKVTAAGTSQAWCSSTLDFYGPKATKLPKGSKIKEVFGKLPAGH